MLTTLLPYLFPVLVVGLILRRSSRPRNINPGRMWIYPALLTVAVLGGALAGPLPGLLTLGVFAVAALVGAGLGYLRAQHQTLSVDAKTGKISSQATAVGTLLLAGLFALRFGWKLLFPSAASHGVHSAEIDQGANGLLIFTAAMLLTQSARIWQRTRLLLAVRAAAPADQRSD